MTMPVDIALFAGDPRDLEADPGVLYQAKHQLEAGRHQLRLVVDQVPRYGGIDPFVKLIDRDSADNLIGF